jgi:hypothetical protein
LFSFFLASHFDFTQALHSPLTYGASRRFDTTPSSPKPSQWASSAAPLGKPRFAVGKMAPSKPL